MAVLPATVNALSLVMYRTTSEVLSDPNGTISFTAFCSGT